MKAFLYFFSFVLLFSSSLKAEDKIYEYVGLDYDIVTEDEKNKCGEFSCAFVKKEIKNKKQEMIKLEKEIKKLEKNLQLEVKEEIGWTPKVEEKARSVKDVLNELRQIKKKEIEEKSIHDL